MSSSIFNPSTANSMHQFLNSQSKYCSRAEKTHRVGSCLFIIFITNIISKIRIWLWSLPKRRKDKLVMNPYGKLVTAKTLTKVKDYSLSHRCCDTPTPQSTPIQKFPSRTPLRILPLPQVILIVYQKFVEKTVSGSGWRVAFLKAILLVQDVPTL